MENLISLPLGHTFIQCSLCNQAVGFKIKEIQEHFSLFHVSTQLPAFSVITASLQSLALSCLQRDGSSIRCRSCTMILPSSSEQSIRHHFRSQHSWQLSAKAIAAWVEHNAQHLSEASGNETTLTTSSVLHLNTSNTAFWQQSQVLCCPIDACEFTTIYVNEVKASQQNLYQHLRKMHENDRAWQRGEMKQLALSVSPTQGQYISKRRAVSDSTGSIASSSQSSSSS